MIQAMSRFDFPDYTSLQEFKHKYALLNVATYLISCFNGVEMFYFT